MVNGSLFKNENGLLFWAKVTARRPVLAKAKG
jgi:hypothetical protein